MDLIRRREAAAALAPLLHEAVGDSARGAVNPSVFARTTPFVVVGCADVGAMGWCEAKANFKQITTEPGFAARAQEVIAAATDLPSFVFPRPSVCALKAAPPREAGPAPSGEVWWEKGEREETVGCWSMAFVASLESGQLQLSPSFRVILIGIVDGVRQDGTVVEVRCMRPSARYGLDEDVVAEKATQANLYAFMLGLPRWTCIFRRGEDRWERSGATNGRGARDALARAVRLRAELDDPRGVSPARKGRCVPRHGAPCEYFAVCPVSPAR